MIRYPITSENLLQEIAQKMPGWQQRAGLLTEELRSMGRFFTSDEGKGKEIWGEIKQIFIQIQHGKCLYCETRMQDGKEVPKVHEVEHYRPKAKVVAWPSARSDVRRRYNITWETGGGAEPGYYLLAYHPLNYAIACTRCNSSLKKNYFPIAGERQTQANNPASMNGEKPLLLFPFGDLDADDPQDLIAWDGVLPKPRHDSGLPFQRAISTIAFFKLDSEALSKERARVLLGVWLALETVRHQAGTSNAEKAQVYLQLLCGSAGAYSACAQAFQHLYHENYLQAQRISDLLLPRLMPNLE